MPNLASVDWKASVEKQQPEFSLLHSNILFAFSSAGQTNLLSLSHPLSLSFHFHFQFHFDFHFHFHFHFHFDFHFYFCTVTPGTPGADKNHLHRRNSIFLGICLVLGADVWLQLQRGRSNISNVTRPFIVIFVVNILLWIDFNITIVRQNHHHEQPRTSRQYRADKFLKPVQAIGGFPGGSGGADR